MPPLVLLAAALGWNYSRSRQGKSTMCSTARPHVKPLVACALWAGLTAWFLPHFCLPSRSPSERSK